MSRESKPARKLGTNESRPDLIIGIVRPIGVPGERFYEHLETRLNFYHYRAHLIKLSHILSDLAESAGRLNIFDSPDRRAEILINEGNRARREASDDAAVVKLGILRIIEERRISEPPTAFIIDSLKREEEIDFLREVYGESVIVFGLHASLKLRKKKLVESYRIKRATQSPSQLDLIINGLLERDRTEKGKDNHGQDVLGALPSADVFIDTSSQPDSQIGRVIDLIFRNPRRSTPTVAELAMSIADRASATSPELGRRVGAAIVQRDTIVGTGANIHPQTASVPEIDSSALDIHELVGDMLSLLSSDGVTLSDEAKSQLEGDPDGYVSRLLRGVLKKAKVRDLTEFQTTVHAEMGALMAALKCNTDINGATIYVTAFPCHGCAKHLVSLGLKVVYLDPYPKSRAEAMYGSAVSKDFQPFIGVAPRRFDSLFFAPDERKAKDGNILPVDRFAQPYLPGAPWPREVALRERKVIGASQSVYDGE
ncbi:hypothetical protein JIG36_48535 [Actinoplanes sp. LDG1-06]|uniref:CMP/dCMP-type deaminase domain-containing protein n=1 Tax=Paractinoplanes ovalisporus TaxID=2810368 RepID=A0ABS2AU26_9ACTN|nr:deaminase [Actinoplanes ovalisporus]MBM2623370.1 hypothetical protein [Actinoplanes ovalisporus]